MTTAIPEKYIENARELIALQCERQDMSLRAHLYRNGGNDEQPELRALARVLYNSVPRPLDELLAEDEAARAETEAKTKAATRI
jgi:hypothetical protein